MANNLIARKAHTSHAIDRFGGRLLARFIRFAHRTSTPPPLYDEHMAIFRENQPFILAMWHGQFMLLPMTQQPETPARVMLALHRDAEVMAEALRQFNLELIRGAGAGIKGKDRGGAHAFRYAVHALDEGYSVAMTADVPPGPSRRAGHGVVTLAKVSGRPIVPVALASSRFLTLNTWSRLTINLPWSRLGASLGEIVHVPPDATSEQLEFYRQKVETALNVATVDAYTRAGVSPRRAIPARLLGEQGGLPPGLGLKIYRAVTSAGRLAAPLLLGWRERQGKEVGARRAERLGAASIARPAGIVAWFHAASVGEAATVLPLIEAITAARPDVHILLTTGTVTSARLIESRKLSNVIHQFLPLDVPQYVRRFLTHWRPSMAVFVESEIWPNLILETSARDIPMAVVNARISKSSFRRWRGKPGLAHPLFSRFHTVAAQSKAYALRFTDLGAPRVLDAGNLKVDVPPPPVDEALRTDMLGRIGDRKIWLAASTHADEERIVGAVHKALTATHPGLLTVIVPRHPDRAEAIARDLRGLGLTVARRASGEPLAADTDVYLADTVGELGTWFALSPIAFMGKSLSQVGGGHNPIEPIRHGASVVTGPSWGNFNDFYKALLAAKGAIEVKDGDELTSVLNRLLSSPDELSTLRANAARSIAAMSGALALSAELLLPLLPSPSETVLRTIGATGKVNELAP